MKIFIHGLDSPSLSDVIKTYDLPWDIFSLKTNNLKELNKIAKKPEIIVFTLFKAKTSKEFTIEGLRKQFPTSKLFCLSNSFCLFLAEDLAQNGIDGFAVLRESNKTDFLKSLEQVRMGAKSFPSLTTQTTEDFSIKELITIRHISAGLSVKQIAYLWNTKESNIKKRKEFVKGKLKVHTTEEISTWAAVRMNIPKQEELLINGEWLFEFFNKKSKN